MKVSDHSMTCLAQVALTLGLDRTCSVAYILDTPLQFGPRPTDKHSTSIYLVSLISDRLVEG